MHMLAKRILHEQVKPTLEKMLAEGTRISSTEFNEAKDKICIAKELLECDIMLKKMGEYDSDAPKTGASYPTTNPGAMNL